MLEHLLTSWFDVSCLRAAVPESEGQHLQGSYSPAHCFGGPGKFAFSAEMQKELAETTDYVGCQHKILEAWNNFVVGRSTTLVEKSPPNLTKIWWLRQVFPDSRLVILVRDPRAVSSATRKWSRSSLPDLMRHWDVAYSRAIEDWSNEDCELIRYEDIVSDPARELSRLGKALALVEKLSPDPIDGRFSELRDMNDKYFAANSETIDGTGAWQKFGYTG